MDLSGHGGLQTLRVDAADGVVTVTLHRPEARNSINAVLLEELHAVLDAVEADARQQLIVLKGQPGTFCTGMDFDEVSTLRPDATAAEQEVLTRPYMRLLRRMATMSRVIISHVDGEVLAGGVGFVAASDLVVATPRSRFSLSEVLWGLMPAMVIPYLIRRVGYQPAYRMALTTQPVSAEAALGMNLVDEVSDSPEAALRRLKARLSRVQPATVGNLKRYFRQVWVLSDEVEELAVSEISRLMVHGDFQKNLRDFVEHQLLPWEAKDR
ncbi:MULTISPECIES: enoyl-CoA hydratase-related protein [Corallococcus]|uniref:enoyl-CoA hydratase-related protein n=1 Tax=Corallococcus TaxID=83461 RepID=UPI0030C6E192